MLQEARRRRRLEENVSRRDFMSLKELWGEFVWKKKNKSLFTVSISQSNQVFCCWIFSFFMQSFLLWDISSFSLTPQFSCILHSSLISLYHSIVYPLFLFLFPFFIRLLFIHSPYYSFITPFPHHFPFPLYLPIILPHSHKLSCSSLLFILALLFPHPLDLSPHTSM